MLSTIWRISLRFTCVFLGWSFFIVSRGWSLAIVMQTRSVWQSVKSPHEYESPCWRQSLISSDFASGQPSELFKMPVIFLKAGKFDPREESKWRKTFSGLEKTQSDQWEPPAVVEVLSLIARRMNVLAEAFKQSRIIDLTSLGFPSNLMVCATSGPTREIIECQIFNFSGISRSLTNR